MSFPWKPPVKKQETPRNAFVDGTVKLIASCGYVGYIPVAPGTLGSMAAIGLAYRYFLMKLPLVPFYLFLVYLGLYLFGVWLTPLAREIFHTDAWNIIVYDKALGALIAVSGFKEIHFTQTFGRIVLAFVVYRLLEILKVFPLNVIEKLPKGWGIMSDDVVAGIITLVIIINMPDTAWDAMGLALLKTGQP